jgi:hypothetical protein
MALHQKSIDYLISIDRQLLLNEINSTKDEAKKLNAEVMTYQENERVLKRESKLKIFKKYLKNTLKSIN